MLKSSTDPHSIISTFCRQDQLDCQITISAEGRLFKFRESENRFRDAAVHPSPAAGLGSTAGSRDGFPGFGAT